MKRLLAAVAIAATLGATGCSGTNSTPTPTLSPMVWATNECSPERDQASAQFTMTVPEVAHLLDIPAQATIYRPPNPWNGTQAGLMDFGLDTFHSTCDLLDDVFQRAGLGGLWKIELVMATKGTQLQDCQNGIQALGDDPYICSYDEVMKGYYIGRIVEFPFERLQLGLHLKSGTFASAQVATAIMSAALDITIQGESTMEAAACAAGVWQAKLVAQHLRTPDTNQDFADGTSKPDAAKAGINGFTIGKCIQQYQPEAAPKNGGSPSAGALPSALSLPPLLPLKH